MTRETVAAKAQRLLLDGAVVVEAAGVGYFTATVRGSTDYNLVTFGRGGWSCTCRCRTTCSHLLAVRLIAPPAYGRLITAPVLTGATS